MPFRLLLQDCLQAFFSRKQREKFSLFCTKVLYDLLRTDLPDLLWKGIEPCHQAAVLLLGQFSCFFSGPRPYKGPVLKAFIEKKESCSFPKKPFDPVTSLPAEQKKDVLFIRVQIIFGSDDLRQAVDPLSEICIAALSPHKDKSAYPHRIIILIFFETPLR